MMFSSLEDAYGAAVERLAELSGQNGELSDTVDQLRAAAAANSTDAAAGSANAELQKERDEANAKLVTLMGSVKKLSSGTASASFQQAVSEAVKLPTEARHAALGRLSWDDLDDEVNKQNAILDRTIESTSPTNTTLDDDIDNSKPESQLSDLRMRLRGKLRKLLHDSNSIRIRSAALSPTKIHASAESP